jgi:hypothetical protein
MSLLSGFVAVDPKNIEKKSQLFANLTFCKELIVGDLELVVDCLYV